MTGKIDGLVAYAFLKAPIASNNPGIMIDKRLAEA